MKIIILVTLIGVGILIFNHYKYTKILKAMDKKIEKEKNELIKLKKLIKDYESN